MGDKKEDIGNGGFIYAAQYQSKSEMKFQRPAFGFMKETGKVNGDIVNPILNEDTWEVLR